MGRFAVYTAGQKTPIDKPSPLPWAAEKAKQTPFPKRKEAVPFLQNGMYNKKVAVGIQRVNEKGEKE